MPVMGETVCSCIRVKIYCDCAEVNTESVGVIVLLHKSPSGFGMTMSGYCPVCIQALQEGNFSQFLFYIQLDRILMTVCKSVRHMLSVRCLSCLSVILVYCGQTVGRIKMKLGMQVGLGPGHIVLDSDPAPPPQKGGRAPTIFRPYLLRPNGWMDQDATW